jgi:hypothetical protein
MTSQWKISLFASVILVAACLIFVSISPVHATIQQSDIISFWTLDETIPGNYTDSISGNDGVGATDPVPTTDPAPGTDAWVPGAQVFNGIDDGITVQDNNPDPNLDFDWGVNDSFSIEVWFKGIPGPGGTCDTTIAEVMVGRADATFEWWLGCLGGQQPGDDPGVRRARFRLADNDGNVVGISPPNQINDGNWHHLVGVRDVSDPGNKEVRLYFDGALADSEPDPFTSGFDNSAADVDLGFVPTFELQGTLDEVAIYGRALTSTEVQQLFDGQDGPRYFVDLDNDGITDGEENAGPNGGDGNLDAIPDMNQNTVVSLLTNDGTDYVIIETDAGTLANCQAVTNPSPDDTPSRTNFDWGFFEFTINGVGFGGNATVTLRTPAGSAPTTYWKYGPPDPQTPAVVEWYEFMDDGTTGAQITDNIVTLEFIDAQRGDDTGDNGIIVDQGGPATVTAKSGGGGGGGGCFIATAGYGF